MSARDVDVKLGLREDGAALTDDELKAYLQELLDQANEVGVFEVKSVSDAAAPIPMTIWCPKCGDRHVDRGVFATKPHHTHSCQNCGLTWRPAVVPTVGVEFLPGFKDQHADYPDPLADIARPPRSRR